MTIFCKFTLVALIYFCFAITVAFDSSQPNIILNVFDKKGLQGSIWFIKSIQLFSKACIGRIYLFIKPELLSDYNFLENSIKESIILKFYKNSSLPDVSIRKHRSKPELVTNILESWLVVSNELFYNESLSGLTVSLCFNNDSIPNATPNFLHITERLDNNDIILLGKTQSLTSVSDWHDLLIVAFNMKNKYFSLWLKTFYDEYYSHNLNRKTFSMLEPRPTLMEANLQFRNSLSIGYFDDSEICSTSLAWSTIYTEENKNITSTLLFPQTCRIGHIMNQTIDDNSNNNIHPHHESRCHHLSMKSYINHGVSKSIELLTGIELHCGKENDNNIKPISDCLLLHKPPYRKENIHHDLAESISDFTGKSKPQWTNNIMHLLWRGVIRFRGSNSEDTPRPFCWDSGSDNTEELAKCQIEYNLTHAEPFTHPDHIFYSNSKSNISAVMMTGTSGGSKSLNELMYHSLSKQYYCARHGYSFHVTTSNEYFEYFQHDLFKDMPSGSPNDDYFYGIMSKPVMVLDVMHKYPDKEWVIWTDDDTYINTGFLYLPLDAFLSDVPPDKVFVLANYRSAFTNLFAVRNNRNGRRVMRDWIAVSMSGYIQCHGYDQAALGVLIANRFSGDYSFSKTFPLNFSCLYNATGTTGCNAKGDWSCDFKYEWALYNAGFKTDVAHGFFGDKISSFSKGCANNYVSEFHIISETSRRPRFQCGLCTRPSEIESSDNWDGPLGGGNNLLIPGTVNSWFFNHKMGYLFYEQYIDPKNCKKLEGFIPFCNELVVEGNSNNKRESLQLRPDGRLISLTDGFAFDLDKGSYCKLTNKLAINKQKEDTYMKEYKEIIAIVNKYTDDEFKRMYQSTDGGYGRHTCLKDPGSCPFGAKEDGMKNRRPNPPYKENDNKKFFERENYCNTCVEKVIDNFDNLGYTKKILDCKFD